jgi:2-polyprenyl-6-methoxyphenol hydroxylase-like FAD-dependent oxidoreductase
MNDRPLIVGAGPTGLAAALFLSLKGIAARIIDKAPEPEKQSRALVINPRALELLRRPASWRASGRKGTPSIGRGSTKDGR